MIAKQKQILILSSFISLLSFSSCASMEGKNSATYDGTYYPTTGSSDIADYDGKSEADETIDMPEETDITPKEDEKEEHLPKPSQLTAACYDDNEHYNYRKNLIDKGQSDSCYFDNLLNELPFKAQKRLQLKVKNNLNAKFELLENENTTFTTASLNTGIVNLFANSLSETYKVKATFKDNGVEKTQYFDVKDGDTIDLEATQVKEKRLQLLFVIDYTGSMGDECSYIKSEIINVVDRIKEAYNDVSIFTGAIAYKDIGDDFVTLKSDFTSNVNATQNFIASKKVNGGGDFEEAVELALDEANKMQWYDDSTTKLIFHIADAPAHDDKMNLWNENVLNLAKKGVILNTVASSGIDKKTEYCFRSQSVLTSGKYIYLTDDSGIGNKHHQNNLEVNPTVEYLNSCITRVIKGYYSGTFEQPIYYMQEQ